MRPQRALHIASAVLFVALAALVTGYVVYVWLRMGARVFPAPLVLAQFVARLALPLLVLAGLYLRPSRTGRWVALVLLVGLILQHLYGGFSMVTVVRSQYLLASRSTPSTLPSTFAAQMRRGMLLAAAFYGLPALLFVGQTTLVALSRRYWERIADEPRWQSPESGPPPSPLARPPV